MTERIVGELAAALGTTPLDLFNNEAATFELVLAQMLFAATVWDWPRVRRRVLLAFAGMAIFDLALVVVRNGIPAAMASHLANFFLLFLASCVAVWFVLRCDSRRALTVGICGYAVQHVAAALEEVIAVTVAQSPLGPPSWLIGELTRIVVFAVTYALIWHFFIRRRPIVETGMESMASLLFLVASVLFITLFVSSYVYIEPLPEEVQLIIRSVSFLVCLMTLLVFGELSRNRKLSDELAFTRRMEELQARHYDALRDTIETTNIHYHDLKHQLLALREGLDEGVFGGAGDAIAGISRDIDVYADMSKTGNPSLDVVLTQKAAECRRWDIRFTCMADGSCLDWMGDRDVYSLFGNALDNAIEAVRRLDDPGKRVIKMTATARGSLAVVHVTNYYDEVRVDKNGELVTTKEDATSHGYGTRSIRRIAERLGGDASFDASDGVFDLSVVLPIPEPPTVS